MIEVPFFRHYALISGPQLVLSHSFPLSSLWNRRVLIPGENTYAIQRYTSKVYKTELQACRDLYYTHDSVELEQKVNAGKSFFTMFSELFSVPWNCRAAWVRNHIIHSAS